MRTPLNAVIGLANMALETPEIPDNVAEYLAMIDRSSRSLQTLLNDMLDMSKIEKRIAELHPERYEYEEFLDTIKAVFRPLCEQKKISFTVEDDAPHSALLVDKARLNQIFLNLISNAVRYTEEGGEVKLAVKGRLSYDVVLFDFVISDTGCGMSEEFLSHVFEPFAQEKPGGGQRDGGSGLGVPLAKSYIEMMGGTISIKSELGAGTEVSIHLELPTDKNTNALEARVSTLRENALDGARIMLVEDIPINTAIIKNSLQRAGATVFCAENGRAAIDLFTTFEQYYIDAIVMDIFMPVMDGLEASRSIRALSRPDASSVPIVALSANAFEHDRELSLQAGMNAHLRKPVDGGELVGTLAELIASKQA